MYQSDGGTYVLWIPHLLHIPIWIYPQIDISHNGYAHPSPHGFYFPDNKAHGANMGPTQQKYINNKKKVLEIIWYDKDLKKIDGS